MDLECGGKMFVALPDVELPAGVDDTYCQKHCCFNPSYCPKGLCAEVVDGMLMDPESESDDENDDDEDEKMSMEDETMMEMDEDISKDNK